MGNWDKTPEIDLFSDGGAEPNPGNGGFGVIMSYKGKRKEFFNPTLSSYPIISNVSYFLLVINVKVI